MLAQLGKEMGTERFQQLKQLAQAVVADQRSWCKHAVLALCMYACFLPNQPWLHASVQRHCYVIVLMPSLTGVATAPLATEALLLHEHPYFRGRDAMHAHDMDGKKRTDRTSRQTQAGIGMEPSRQRQHKPGGNVVNRLAFPDIWIL